VALERRQEWMLPAAQVRVLQIEQMKLRQHAQALSPDCLPGQLPAPPTARNRERGEMRQR
jgi:hypothetical protein